MDGIKNKLVVYTAIFGNYDNLIEPKEKYDGCDFICFTDQEHIKSNIWEIRHIKECDIPPNVMNRKYKILSHLFLSEYEWSLYVDTNVAILKNPLYLANKYLIKYNMVVPKHFARNCVYEEAKYCVMLGKAKYDEVKKQMDEYKKDGLPENFGLGENGILLRKHNDRKVIKVMNDWWAEFNQHTKRDQLSLSYAIWKNRERFCFMDESARGGKYFSIQLHIHDYKKGFFGYILNLKNKHIANFPNGRLKKINDSIKRILNKD